MRLISVPLVFEPSKKPGTNRVKVNEKPNHSITVLKRFLQSMVICNGVQDDTKTLSYYNNISNTMRHNLEITVLHLINFIRESTEFPSIKKVQNKLPCLYIRLPCPNIFTKFMFVLILYTIFKKNTLF